MAADFIFISLRGKLDMHGVHGRRWSVCVGCEDRKMAARLMKRSGATLIRDGGKSLVRKARRRKLVGEAGSKDEEEEDDQWKTRRGFLAEE
jgi:hypothetical protein